MRDERPISRANVGGPGGNEARAGTIGNDLYADVSGSACGSIGAGRETCDTAADVAGAERSSIERGTRNGQRVSPTARQS
jgi:hypothetical protein